ncbi:MAG TPA: hypothetical protein VMX57_02180 [Planctomycetota bacterium]|nr:hypothetical protein [Planctomycetota bacterium]
MNDIEKHRGPVPWGRAYRTMLANDAHAPGSVDRVLVERMVLLCSETVGYLYERYTPTVGLLKNPMKGGGSGDPPPLRIQAGQVGGSPDPPTKVGREFFNSPTVVGYERGGRPGLEDVLARVTTPSTADEERIAAISRFCTSLGADVPDDLDAMRLGGTEEEILRRGSDWCTDVARVGCILCQVADVPSRHVSSCSPTPQAPTADTSSSKHSVRTRGARWT